MRLFGLLVGGLITLVGLSIMLTPLRTYFLIGWITGCVLLCNGLSMVGVGTTKGNKSLSKCVVGGITAIVGFILLMTDKQQTITQILVVNLISGGVVISGIIECIIGYMMVKRNKKGVHCLIMGGLSIAMGIAGMLFRDATVIVVGMIVGYHIVRIGATIFMFAWSMEKPKVIDIND